MFVTLTTTFLSSKYSVTMNVKIILVISMISNNTDIVNDSSLSNFLLTFVGSCAISITIWVSDESRHKTGSLVYKQ